MSFFAQNWGTRFVQAMKRDGETRERMHHCLPQITVLDAIFSAASDFGLTDEEMRRTVYEVQFRCWVEAGTEAPDVLDQVPAALAREILDKQRRVLSQQRS